MQYVGKVLKNFGLVDCKPVSTPLPEKTILHAATRRHTKLALTPSCKSSALSCIPCWVPGLTLPMPSAPSCTFLHALGCCMFKLSNSSFDTSGALLAIGSFTPVIHAGSPHRP